MEDDGKPKKTIDERLDALTMNLGLIGHTVEVLREAVEAMREKSRAVDQTLWTISQTLGTVTQTLVAVAQTTLDHDRQIGQLLTLAQT